jgi:hypothetical protein
MTDESVAADVREDVRLDRSPGRHRAVAPSTPDPAPDAHS